MTDNGTGPGLSCSSISLFFLFILHFLFVPCGRLSWLSVSFLLHVKYIVLYRIVSYLDSKGNYSATAISNNTKLVHWPLMGGLLHHCIAI